MMLPLLRTSIRACKQAPMVYRPISTSAALDKGHSKWQNIKATKGKNDMMKSQATNVLLRKVKSAVRKGGFDIKLNRELGNLEQEFRANGLPLETFKNCLQRLKDKPEVALRYELIGPGGSFFIIEMEATNKTTATSALQKYINKVGGFRIAADSAAVLTWFDAKGVVSTESNDKDGKQIPFDKAEEMGIELDCEQVDLIEEESGKNLYEMICDPRKVSAVEDGLTNLGLTIVNAEIEYRPKHPITLSESDAKLVEKFYGFLQEDDSVRQIFDNIQPEA